uniref:HAD family hydrolase n=1 Tax=Prevotella sp. GTC17260 TaxID=3236796 RepID=A0AB33JBN7_9BACT
MIKTNLQLLRTAPEGFSPCVALFDMDGVLYDSMPNHSIAWQRSMASFGIHMTEEDAYATEGMRGIDTIRMLVKQQQNKDIDEVEAQMMYDEKTRQFGLLPTAPIMEGVIDLMDKMRRDGLQIGIVTGSGQRPLIARVLNDFRDFVDEQHIVTAYDVKHGKPAPDPYLMGLQKAGNMRPNEGIVIENAPMGVRAGVAAGIFTVAVNSGPLPNETLAKEGANIVFDNMPQLKKNWEYLLESLA